MSTNAYAVVIPPPEGLPAGLTVRIVVMRARGGRLTRAELEAAAALYPPPASGRAELADALAAAPEAPAKPTRGPAKGAKAPKRPRAKASAKTAPKVPKRAAAKRPAK
jgi:hypothetical protein